MMFEAKNGAGSSLERQGSANEIKQFRRNITCELVLDSRGYFLSSVQTCRATHSRLRIAACPVQIPAAMMQAIRTRSQQSADASELQATPSEFLGPAPMPPSFDAQLWQESGSVEASTSSAVASASDALLSAEEAFVSALYSLVSTQTQQRSGLGLNASDRSTSLADLLQLLKEAASSSTQSNVVVELATNASGKSAAISKDSLNDVQTLVQQVSSTWTDIRAQSLARSLASLLSCLDRLNALCTLPSPNTPQRSPIASRSSSSIGQLPDTVYDTLKREARLLQDSRPELKQALSHDSGSSIPSSAFREVQQAEAELRWGRLDDLLAEVDALCRKPVEADAEPRASTSSVAMQPSTSASTILNYRLSQRKASKEYERSMSDYSISDLPIYSNDGVHTSPQPPQYHDDGVDVADEKTAHRAEPSRPSMSDEKMHYELDDLTSAIERLYVVSPQLANQRVHPNRQKSREMQLAKLGSAIERLSKGRLEDQRAQLPVASTSSVKVNKRRSMNAVEDRKELDSLIDSIGKAANRNMANQRVTMSPRQLNLLEGTRKTVLEASVCRCSSICLRPLI